MGDPSWFHRCALRPQLLCVKAGPRLARLWFAPLCSIRRIRLIRILIRPGCRKDRVIGMRGAIVRLAGAQSRLRGLLSLFCPGPRHWLGTRGETSRTRASKLAHWTTAARVLQQSWQSFKGLAAGHLQFESRGLQAGSNRPHHNCPAKTLDLSISSRLPFFQKPGTIHHLPRDIGARGMPCQSAFFQARQIRGYGAPAQVFLSWNRFHTLLCVLPIET
jgi:hypothetical protein